MGGLECSGAAILVFVAQFSGTIFKKIVYLVLCFAAYKSG